MQNNKDWNQLVLTKPGAGMSIMARMEQVTPSLGNVRIIDVGSGYRDFIDLVRDHASQIECRRRKVKFLPAQVVRRLTSEVKFKQR